MWRSSPLDSRTLSKTRIALAVIARHIDYWQCLQSLRMSRSISYSSALQQDRKCLLGLLYLIVEHWTSIAFQTRSCWAFSHRIWHNCGVHVSEIVGCMVQHIAFGYPYDPKTCTTECFVPTGAHRQWEACTEYGVTLRQSPSGLGALYDMMGPAQSGSSDQYWRCFGGCESHSGCRTGLKNII